MEEIDNNFSNENTNESNLAEDFNMINIEDTKNDENLKITNLLTNLNDSKLIKKILKFIVRIK